MQYNYTNPRNLSFLFNEVHNVADVVALPQYAHFDVETLNMMLDAAKDLADAEMFPYFEEMDHAGVKYENGTVTTHPQLKNIIQKGAEGGWIGCTASEEFGGMGAPEMLFAGACHYFHAANNGALGYLNLTSGAARLILNFASQTLKETYLHKMYAGQWQGTMALTEPQAGSSLSDIVSTAKPTADGHYLMKGQKIYISAGDHLACDNFVHLMLARIDGAPAGTKGISLFVVPKFRPNGEQLAFNDVTTAGNYAKMGQKCYTTTHLMFGEADDCHGWLVGEPHKGLTYMFQMMNEARLSVGLMAASTATAAYQASLQYAKERPQGRKLNEKDPTAAPTPIINHPDVRRMLWLQKSITEGAMSLVMECAKLADFAAAGPEDKRHDLHLLLELLTPVCKTYPTEAGAVSISNGLQCFGGGGYCYDFPLQQYYRDIRIMSIYEGTTGIQSLDLLGRKMTLQNGKAVQILTEMVMADIAKGMASERLKPYAEKLAKEMGRLQEVFTHLLPKALAGDTEKYLADATVFMEMFGLITVAWQWLKQGLTAEMALPNAQGEDEKAFYESKFHTLSFFYTYELPKTRACAEVLKNELGLTLPMEKELLC